MNTMDDPLLDDLGPAKTSTPTKDRPAVINTTADASSPYHAPDKQHFTSEPAHGEAGVLSQFAASVARCCVLKARKPVSCAVEILLPIAFIAMLAWLSTLITDTYQPGQLFVDPTSVPLPSLRAQLQNTTCLNISSASPAASLSPADTVLAAIIPRCDANLAYLPAPSDCGATYTGQVSPNLCLRGGGVARNLGNFFNDLNRAVTVPSMDEILIAHAACNEAFGAPDYTFPQPTVNNGMRLMGSIYISPDNAASRAFAASLNASAGASGFRLLNHGFFGGYMESQSAAFGYFRSEAGAGKAFALLNVNGYDVTTGVFDVTISMNKTATMWTNRVRNRFAHGAGTAFQLYFAGGFLSVQRTLLAAFAGDTANQINSGVPDSFTSLTNNAAASSPMPYIGYTRQIFLQLAGFLVPFTLSLSFLACVSSVAERLVQEKELRLREAMAAMGVGKTTLFMAWLVTFCLINFVTASACTMALSLTFMPKSVWLVIFVLFLGFAISTTALGCLLSSLFSKSRTAAIATPIIFFACAIPSFALGPDADASTLSRYFLLSPTAFAAGLKVMLDYEQINGFGWADLFNANDDIPVGVAIVTLYIDFALYTFLTWYFDNVLGGEWGVRKHPCFCFTGFCAKHRHPEDTPQEMSSNGGPKTLSDVSEAYPAGEEAVDINGVGKEFGSGDEKKVAVRDVSLRIYPAMVTAVLGHNGAGKTTLFNMLTGMLPITHGDCYIFGHSITDASTDARRNIGMCPQHNVLWDDLTCYEHLVYFAMVKGLPRADCPRAADEMLERVDLASKRNAPSASLSGGQKRKLSVAIAFIGGSKLVLLDEPTAGMDVHTRRHTWELIQQMAREEGRAIILTTHFMDEAELLGDRVAIMAAGQLHSYGSTTYLKSTLGQAYTLNVQYEHPPEASARKQVLSTVCNSVPSATEKEARGREQMITLPMEDVAKFADMLRSLEKEQKRFGLSSFSMSAATIEDVFVAIAHAGDDDVHTVTSAAAARSGASAPAAAAASHSSSSENGPQAQVAAVLASGEKGNPSTATQFVGLMKKRLNVAKRDRRALVLQIALPILCLLMAMALSNTGPPDTPLADINPEVLPDPQTAVVGGACGTAFADGAKTYIGNVDEQPSARNSRDVAEYLMTTYNGHGGSDRPSAIQCMDSTQTSIPGNTSTTMLLSNSTAYMHSAPYTMLLWFGSRDAAMRANRNATRRPLRMSTAPLPFTVRESASINTFTNVIVAILVVVPFSFVPSTFTGFVVKERASKAKLLQFVSGVGYGSYWASNFLFDLASYGITMILAIIIFAIFGKTEYTGGDAIGSTLLLFLLYGLAAIPTSYVMSLPFNNHSTAQNAVLGVFFLAGFGLTLAGYLIELLKGPVDLIYLFRLFPPACLGEGLMALANAPSQEQLGEDVSRLALDNAGWPMLFLALETVLLSAIILFVDHPERAKRQQMLNYNASHELTPPVDEPTDVRREREVVKTATGDDAFLKVVGLRKEFPAPAGSESSTNVAVQNLTFRVPKGEIFGLLGTNGAGKTTSMNVITGECLPSSGAATVSGFDVVTQAGEARQLIGYCPQFDALHDLMTVDEHLELYCALRGIADVATISTTLTTALGLAEYRRVKSKSLSGGNKRKLSVAIAMVGSPKLLLLDEPTAGMDPVARRSMCDVVSAVSKHCAVVLTTHHLEEVEALADRAAIMVAGRMQCLGTLEHLKATLGEGYQVSLRLESEDKAKAVGDKLDAAYPGACKLTEQHQTRLRFTVKNKGDMTLSALFALLHDLKTGAEQDMYGVLDYTVSQSSVEEVFLAVAGGHTADEADADIAHASASNSPKNASHSNPFDKANHGSHEAA